MNRGFIVRCLGFAGAASAARADIVYTQQARSVTCTLSSFIGPTSNAVSHAPNLLPWNGIAEVFGPPPTGGHGRAQQISSLDPDGIHLQAFLLALRPAAMGTGQARVDSSLSVTFSITESTPFHLVGDIPAPPNFPPPATLARRLVRLVGPGINIELTGAYNAMGNGPGAFNLSGIMAPGSYQFTVVGEYIDGVPLFQPLPMFETHLYIPVPGSGLMLLAGTSTLAWRRRR